MEAGMFAILVGMAFIFMMISFKFGALFKMFSAIIFFALAVILFAEYDIAFTTITTTVSGATLEDVRFIIDSTNGLNMMLAWIFIGLGTFNGFLFFIEMIPR
jgi:hypothetical protein